MTADDARLIVTDYLDLRRRGKKRGTQETSSPSYRQKQLRVACITRLVEEPRLSRADQGMLARLSVRVFADPDEHDLHGLILQSLRQHAYGRRWLYRYFASEVIKGNPRPPHYLRRILTYADLPWLLARAESRWNSIPAVWADLYFLAMYGSERDTTDRSSVDRVLGAIARYAPTIPAEFEKTKHELEQQEREIEDEQRRRRGNIERHTIADVVDQVLHREDWTDVDRLRQLSLLCFSGDVWRYRDVDGKWGDLDVDHQRAVLEVCRNGLREGTPTPFPDASTFTTWNFAEAHSFVAVVESWPSGEWLDARNIEKWLPTVLRTHVPKALEAVMACAARDRPATTAVVIAMIEAELRRGENHMIFANFIPAELWPGDVGEASREFRER